MDAGLFSTLKNVKLTSHKRRCTDNDFVDRINCFYTPFIITIFTIVICTKSYIVGAPLQCWVPREFSKGWEQFAESYCFIKNTYYIPTKNELPTNHNERKGAELQYYQWVPFVLGLQSMLFLIPSLFWKFTNWQAKLHIKPLVERSVVSSFECGNTKLATLSSVAEHIKLGLLKNRFTTHGTLRDNILEKQNQKCFGFINSGFYLTFCYFITKLLYIGNILIQFLIVQSFLKVDFTFGFNLLRSLITGSDWQQTGLFPRVTLCDFTTHQLGQPLSYTMQCVLVINLFNEKIYIFLWFWFVFLFIITVFSLLLWMFRMLFNRQLMSFISKKSEYNIDNNRNQQLLRCESDMTMDAYFVLRLIEENCGLFTARKVVQNLISYYEEKSTENGLDHPPPGYHDISKKEHSKASSES